MTIQCVADGRGFPSPRDGMSGIAKKMRTLHASNPFPLLAGRVAWCRRLHPQLASGSAATLPSVPGRRLGRPPANPIRPSRFPKEIHPCYSSHRRRSPDLPTRVVGESDGSFRRRNRPGNRSAAHPGRSRPRGCPGRESQGRDQRPGSGSSSGRSPSPGCHPSPPRKARARTPIHRPEESPRQDAIHRPEESPRPGRNPAPGWSSRQAGSRPSEGHSHLDPLRWRLIQPRAGCDRQPGRLPAETQPGLEDGVQKEATALDQALTRVPATGQDAAETAIEGSWRDSIASRTEVPADRLTRDPSYLGKCPRSDHLLGRRRRGLTPERR